MDPKRGQKRTLSDDEEDEVARPSFGGGGFYNGSTFSKDYGLSESRSLSSKRKHEENLSDDSDEPNNESTSSKQRKASEMSFRPSSLASEFTATAKSINPVASRADDRASGSSNFSAAKLMRKMGYQEGKGLGKEGQGIVKPIEESNQQGKRGLGFAVKNFDKRMEWDFENDPVSSRETPEWLENPSEEVPLLKDLLKWKKMGSKKRILDDEDKFCSRETLQQVLECKSIFDNLDDRDMRSARSRANPFEAIGSRFFQNRAALKMANIDAVFDFMFTDPKYKNGKSKIEPQEPLYFCDVCAGPGGFSEYVLWRKKWASKGFGFTLKGDNDFKLADFLAGAPEYFEPHYGVNGINGDGDVTKSQNLKEFQKFVVSSTNHLGVHFMMADGGFSVEGNENIQEILSKQLYLCQFLCALSVLRLGGNFVCKLFDLFTPFSVGLVYLMYLCFDRICIHKPVTSRPANSERYIICEGARETKDVIYDYLFDINDTLNATFADEKSSQDVESIVPLSVLQADKDFFDYIYKSNETIGKVQVFNLKKVQAFATNKGLFDYRQSQLIDECLKYWQIPNLTRMIYVDQEQLEEMERQSGGRGGGGFNKRMRGKFVPKPVPPYRVMQNFENRIKASILNTDPSSLGNCKVSEIDQRLVEENFKKCSIYDYKCVMACGTLVLLFGCGGTNVFELEFNSPLNCFGSSNNRNASNIRTREWRPLETIKIDLPKNTLLLAEKLDEYRGLDEKQIKSTAIHILDAYFIEGEDLMDVNGMQTSIADRHERLEVFVKSISKNSRNDLNKVRLADLLDLTKIKLDVFNNLLKRTSKFDQSNKYAIHIPLSFASEYYVYPRGIYFFKHVQSPWSICLSKSTQMFYYYKSDTAFRSYEIPKDRFFYSNPRYYLENILAWKWSRQIDNISGDKKNNDEIASDSSFSRAQFEEFMRLHGY